MAQTTSKSGTTKKETVPPKTLKASSKKVAVKPAAEASAGKSTKTKAATKTSTAKAATIEKEPAKKAVTRSKTSVVKGDGAAPVSAKRSKSSPPPMIVTSEQRYRMICEAAYFRAEKRGFINGNPEQDWLDAEMEVDKQLSGM